MIFIQRKEFFKKMSKTIFWTKNCSSWVHFKDIKVLFLILILIEEKEFTIKDRGLLAVLGVGFLGDNQLLGAKCWVPTKKVIFFSKKL